MKPGTSIVNTDEYIELKEFKRKVLKGHVYTTGPEISYMGLNFTQRNFHTESKVIKDLTDQNKLLRTQLKKKTYTTKQLLKMLWDKIH